MTYKGSMKNGKLAGQGSLIHHDTSNEYHGQFDNNQKHGPGEFILNENGKISKFTGEFSHGVEVSSKSKYSNVGLN